MAPRQRRLSVYESTDGYRWRLVAPNGSVIADSGEAYPSNALAIKAARSLLDLTKPVQLVYNVIRKGKIVSVEEEQLHVAQL